MRSNHLLDTAQKLDARLALQILTGSGLTLAEAARLALDARASAPAPPATLPWDDLVMSFLADTVARGRRGATITYYGTYLGIYGASPLSSRWQSVERPEFAKWLRGQPGAHASRAMILRSVRTAYRWAGRQEPPLCASDPTEGIQLDAPRESSPAYYTPAACAAMLALLPDRHRWPVALQLFAGIRPEEIAPKDPKKPRLLWSNIDPAARIIRIPAEVAKTGRGRVIEELPDTLWRWLPTEAQTGAVWPLTAAALHLEARWAMKPVKWIMRGLRHTFATYAVALSADTGRVAMWLGHEGKPAMLHRHYRGIATRAEAEAFWGLKPTPKK